MDKILHDLKDPKLRFGSSKGSHTVVTAVLCEISS